MADYRAKNRNDKVLGLARVRAAARPAPGIVRKDEIERQAWADNLVQNEMGVWYPKQKTSAGKKLDAAVDFLPTSALIDFGSGVYNLATQDRSAIESISALPGVIGRSIMAPEKTDLEKKLWEEARGNPYAYRKLLNKLTPQQQAQNSINTKIKSNEKDYNDMVSMLRDTGISEEEMYRDVVVGPDGQVNLNANVQGALSGIGYAADALRGTELIGYGLGKPVGLAARAATKAVIPRAVGVATNPRIINAGMQSVEAAARGARPGEVITTGVAALVAGNKPVSNGALRLTPEQHGSLASDGLDAKAPRGGNRGLAATIASNVQSALRRPPAGSGGKRVPVGEMKVKFTAEDAVRIAQENPEIMKNNAAYIDLYRASPQGNNKPGSIYIHAHPPGMNPSEVRNVLPDHLTSGPLNDLETKVNGARRADGRDPLTNYTDIVTEGIALAKTGKFKEGTWNAKLADMTLEEAQVYLGANSVKYW